MPHSHVNEHVVTFRKGNHFSVKKASGIHPRVALSVAGGAAGKNNAKDQHEVLNKNLSLAI